MIKADSLDKILILDFGSQYTQLIARKIREQSVYCEIHPFNYGIENIKKFAPKGIILSGGPSSVYDDKAPLVEKELIELGIPVLGICYGMQLISHLLGGKVFSSDKREYGRTEIQILSDKGLFEGFDTAVSKTVWMSHGDKIEKLPDGFEIIAKTSNTPYCAIANKGKQLYAVQFHPEVVHTQDGIKVLRNFIFGICGCSANWDMGSFIKNQLKEIKEKVGDKNVILGLSGGVDSSVAAVLINNAIGHQLKCIFVNNGVLRQGEAQKVIDIFKNNFNVDLIYVDASKRFLDKLKGVEDPEKKRKIIGYEFIEVFNEEAKKIQNVKYLAQGTLYPDVIESVSFKGPSDVIKSHHNVGGLPEKMDLELLEPFRELFKDEVREIGRELKVTDEIVNRQPFPGPGLAVRIIGEVTEERLDILRQADAIVSEEIKAAGLYYKLWQSFAVLLPVKSVGVMGDERTYENVCAVRAVESQDAMTADWAHLPYDVLGRISTRIINEVKGINRVCYDISSKPPATIEWE